MNKPQILPQGQQLYRGDQKPPGAAPQPGVGDAPTRLVLWCPLPLLPVGCGGGHPGSWETQHRPEIMNLLITSLRWFFYAPMLYSIRAFTQMLPGSRVVPSQLDGAMAGPQTPGPLLTTAAVMGFRTPRRLQPCSSPAAQSGLLSLDGTTGMATRSSV